MLGSDVSDKSVISLSAGSMSCLDAFRLGVSCESMTCLDNILGSGTTDVHVPLCGLDVSDGRVSCCLDIVGLGVSDERVSCLSMDVSEDSVSCLVCVGQLFLVRV